MSVPVKLLWSLGAKKSVKESRESTATIDASDTLNWKMTPLLLSVFVVIIGSSQAFGEPVSCFNPQEMKMWYKYVSAYCFLEGSYSLRPNETLSLLARMPAAARMERQRESPIDYYQWVPFMLSFQLVGFLAPGLIWKWTRKRQSVDLDAVLALADDIRDAMSEEATREGKMASLVEYVFECLRGSPHSSARDKHTLTICFLGIKTLTLANLLYQFIFLAFFVAKGDVLFGYEILVDLADGKQTSRFFPLEVACDVAMARMGQQHIFTMQCLLSLNFFHDKIFAALWLWYLFLMIYSMVSFLLFAFSLLPLQRSIDRIFPEGTEILNPHTLRSFYSKVLFTDGLLLLTFISKLKGRYMGSEVAERLYAKFQLTESTSAWIYPQSLEKNTRGKGRKLF